MKHVNFETYKHLTESGYPQPERKLGQYWFGLDGVLRLNIYAGQMLWIEETPETLRSVQGDRFSGIDRSEEFTYYCPDATEILQRIQTEYQDHVVRLEHLHKHETYAVAFKGVVSDLDWQMFNENPHDLMAQFYIEIKNYFNGKV